MSTAILRDTRTVFVRELRPVLREPVSIFFALIQPLFFLALFAPLLVDVSGLGEAASLQWFVPGILVMAALVAGSVTGSNLTLEMRSGSHERLLVTPLSRASLLLGRALKEIVPVLAQSVLVIAIVLPFGFSLHVGGALIGLAILATFGVGLGALSYTLALAVKDQDWIFWTVQQTLLFPLMLLSGMLLPVDDGPGWLQVLSALNPLTYVVDAERALFAGDVWELTTLWGVLAGAGVAAVGLLVGVRAMRRGAE